MKRVFSPGKGLYMKVAGIVVLVVALVAGVTGCAVEYDPGPERPVEYSLTISSSAGGSVTAPGEGAFSFDEGTVVDLVAEPDEGYRFVRWTGDVDAVGDVNAATTTITVHGDHALTAEFIAQYSITINATAGGEVTAPGMGTFMYDPGTVIHLAAKSSRGFRFIDWTGDVGTIADVNADSTTITLNGEYEITANFEEEEVVHFADSNLEEAVKDATGIPEGPVYPSDLEQLTLLRAEEMDILDLTGLERATSLRWLYLADNRISDISALSSLTNLTELRLWGNEISDISPLANLTNLKSLSLGYHLGGNEISDISALANLTDLRQLYLNKNQIRDISPLADLTNLKELDLHTNQVSDISPLANLTNLTKLWLHDNEIRDISPLANLTNLTGFGINRYTIGDISRVIDLTRLTNLSLSGTQMSDISALADLTNLTALSLQVHRVRDISPLANLTNLTWLDLRRNQISDISPLANLTRLTRLHLQENQISDISPLANLASLTFLDLANNQISDIKPLVDNPGLGGGDRVLLSNNPLSEQSVNEHIPALQARGVTVDY